MITLTLQPMEMKPNLLLLAILSLAVVSTACSTASTPSAAIAREGFSIYLLEGTSSSDILLADVNSLVLAGSPIVSRDDVVRYDSQTHTLHLTPAGHARILALRVPTSGVPFVVSVDRQPIYAGAFWASYSSLSFDGVVIDVLRGEGNTFKMQLGYPGAPAQAKLADPRSDPRILESFRQAGKLK